MHYVILCILYILYLIVSSTMSLDMVNAKSDEQWGIGFLWQIVNLFSVFVFGNFLIRKGWEYVSKYFVDR